MKHVLGEIKQELVQSYGIDVAIYEETFLQKTLENRCAVNSLLSLADYCSYLAKQPAEAKELVQSLQISYTDFFRDALNFAYLEQWILPKIIERKKNGSEIRIWSAGCSTGQEAYSIAILLEELQRSSNKNLRYRIIATDIGEQELAVAVKASYQENALQNIKLKHLKKYFEKQGDNYLISKKLQAHVSFSNYNLLDNGSFFPQESIFGEFDLICCCNFLFYYKLEQQKFILGKLISAMSLQGYLLTGEAERFTVAHTKNLQQVTPVIAIFQKKIMEVQDETKRLKNFSTD